jgi:hypothetical protein
LSQSVALDPKTKDEKEVQQKNITFPTTAKQAKK